MAGRPRKPTNLRVLEGNRGHRPLPKGEPKPDGSRPSCPAQLPLGAKRIWREMAPVLHAVGCLTKADRHALAAYCIAVSTAQDCAAVIARDGSTEETPKGTAITAQARLLVQVLPLIKSLGTELGLSPASRGKISVPQAVAQGDILDELMGPNV